MSKMRASGSAYQPSITGLPALGDTEGFRGDWVVRVGVGSWRRKRVWRRVWIVGRCIFFFFSFSFLFFVSFLFYSGVIGFWGGEGRASPGRGLGGLI